jgi:drug/metabolite transporter (DMT)-like permease
MREQSFLLAGFCVLAIAVVAAAYTIVTRQYNPVIIAVAALLLTGSLGLLLSRNERDLARRSGPIATIVRVSSVVILLALLSYVAIKMQQAFPR